MDLPMTKFEASYMRTVWDAWISDLEIIYFNDKDKQVCRMIKAKVTSRSKYLAALMIPSPQSKFKSTKIQSKFKSTLTLDRLDAQLAERLIHFLNLGKYDCVEGATWAKTHVCMYCIGVLIRMEDLISYTRTQLLHLWRVNKPAERLRNSATNIPGVYQSFADDVSEKFNALYKCIPRIYQDTEYNPLAEALEGIRSLSGVMTPTQKRILNIIATRIPQFRQDLLRAQIVQGSAKPASA